MQTSKKTFIRSNLRLIAVFIVLILIGLCFWFYKAYYSNPNTVFFGMLSNNLNTKNYEVVSNQVSLTEDIITTTQVKTGFKNIVISTETTKITNSKYTIKTASIGTPSTDYSSYQQISFGKSSSKYMSLIGIWGENSPGGINGQGGQLYKSSIFSTFLFASPSISDTSKLLNFIKLHKVYAIKISKHSNLNGRPIINYQIAFNLGQYAKLLDLYSSLIGYKNKETSVSYSGNQSASLNISVDVLSRDLIGLSYVGSNSAQVYESYGINSNIKLPLKTISLQQLKKDVSSIK